MATQDTTTTATFRAETQGVEQAEAKLRRLEASASGASSATETFSKTSIESAKGVSALERETDSLLRSLAGAPAAWRAYERDMSRAGRSLDAGKISVEDYGRAVQQLQQRLQRVIAPRLSVDVNGSGLDVLLGRTEKVSVAQRQAANEMVRIAQARQQADAEAARAQKILAEETGRYAAEIESLRATYDPTYAAAQRMNKEVADLARLEREGIQIAGGYGDALDRIILKYDDGARAARDAAEAQADFVRRARDAQAQTNAGHVATDNQKRFNSVLGVDVEAVKSARESFDAFEGAAQQAEDMRKAVEQLRAELDPLGTAYEATTEKLTLYQELLGKGLITSEEFTAASARAKAGFEEFASSVGQQGPPAAGLFAEAFTSLRSTILGFVGAYASLNGLRTLGSMADQWSDLSARVGNSIGNMDAASTVMDRLSTIADNTYSSLTLTVESFIANGTAMSELGYSTRQQLNFLGSLNDALVISGARGDRARQVQDALSRAMALGALNGDELNAVLLHGDRVAQALAEELGVGVNALRGLGKEGKITGSVIFEALTGNMEELRAESAEMPAVLEDAAGRFGNAMLRMVGEFDQSWNVSGRLAEVLIVVADHLDEVARAAIVAGVTVAAAFSGPALAAVQGMTVAIGTRMVGAVNALTVAMARNPLGLLAIGATAAVTALALFGDEIQPVQGELATLGDYADATFAAIAQGARSAFGVWQDASLDTVRIVDEASDGALSAWGDHFAAATSMVAGWAEEWGVSLFEIRDANTAAADESARGWEGFVQASLDELRTLVGGAYALKAGFEVALSEIPGLMYDVAVDGANLFITAIESGLNRAVAVINSTMAGINALRSYLGSEPIQLLDPVTIERFEERTSQALANIGEAMAAANERGAAAFDEATRSIGVNAQAQADARAETEATNEVLLDAVNVSGAASGATDELTDALKKARDAFEDQRRSVAEHVAGLQRQIDSFGMSEGAAAALEFRAREMARAWDIAREAGLKALPPETLAAINAATADVERLTDRIEGLGTVRAAVDEFFPIEKAKREAAELQAILDDATMSLTDTERTAVQLQINKGFTDAAEAAERLRTGGKKAAQDIGAAFVSNVGETFADIFAQGIRDGEDFFDSITRGLAGIGSQLAAAGARNLFGALFGLPQDKAAAGVGGFVGGSPVAANSNMAGSSAPLTALNDNLGKASRSALDVARQFNGLNERADSRVLDSFLRASGNWKGLSAADTAWCAAFANAAIMQAGGKGTGSNMASSFADWGVGTSKPKPGDIVVLRPQASGTSGHVGFFEGFTDRGGVRVFSGNSGNQARSSVYDQRSVVGFRTNSDEQRVVARGVEQGLANYGRSAQGSEQSRAPGFLYQNAQGQTVNHVGITRGQQAFGVLGAGAGIFSSGYQSGSPLQGGFSGALGGYQAAQALGFAGPLGAVAGAGLGILGGILGGRAQRKAQHEAAAAEWAKVRPQYEAFDRSLSGEGVGALRESITSMWSQLSGFMETGGKAWKMGQGNSSAAFHATGLKMFEKWFEEVREFRESYEATLEDLVSSQGFQGAFATGRANVKKLDEQIKGFIDDVNIAFGSTDIGIYVDPAFEAEAEKTRAEREREVARAKRAAGEYTLTMLYTSEVVSEVQKAVDSFRGTAAGVVPILQRLGWTAEEAAAAVNDRLTQALSKMRSDFERDVGDRLLSLQGKGYVTEAREMLKEFAQLQADASLLGADQSNFGEILRLQAQAIVDGAELTGDGFAELIRLFPSLNGLVKEFSQTASQTARELAQANLDTARAALDRSYQAETDRINDLLQARRDEASELESTIGGLKDFADSLADLRRSMRLDDNLSTLSPEARVEEARRQFLDLAAKAQAGDADAQAKLAGAGQEYLTEARSFWLSSERYHDAFDEVSRTLDLSETWAKGQLSTSESQLAALKQQISQNEALLESQRREYEALLGINEGIKSLAVAMKEYAAAAAAARREGIAVPGTTAGTSAAPNGGWTAASAPGYLDKNPDVAAAIARGETFGLPAGMSREVYASAHFGLFGQSEGRGWASGGYTGPGRVDEVAGSAHRGEVVWSQRDVSRWGGAEAVNVMRLARMPAIRMPQAPRLAEDGTGDRALLDEVKALREEVRSLRRVSAEGSLSVTGAVEDGNSIAREAAALTKRDRMRPAA